MSTESEKLIHIKFEYEEAVQAKKDILFSQANLLRIAKAVKNYNTFRSEELKLKIKAHKKIKELLTDIGKLQQTIPKIKIPEILQKTFEEDFKGSEGKPSVKIKIPAEKTRYDKDIETQLAEIQARLKRLG